MAKTFNRNLNKYKGTGKEHPCKGFYGLLLSIYTILTYQAQCHRRRKLSLSPESEQ